MASKTFLEKRVSRKFITMMLLWTLEISQSSLCVLLTYALTGLTSREGCLLQYAPFDIPKFSLTARLRGHKQRKVNYHAYSFLLSVSSGARYQSWILYFERSQQVLFLIVVLRVSALKQGRHSIDSSTTLAFSHRTICKTRLSSKKTISIRFTIALLLF